MEGAQTRAASATHPYNTYTHTPWNRDCLTDNTHSQPWWTVPLHQWRTLYRLQEAAQFNYSPNAWSPARQSLHLCPPFPWPNNQGTWHYPHPSSLQFPVLPGGSPLYTGCPQDNPSLCSTNYLGHLPQNKRENHSSSFSGVNLCLCSWYKLNLVTLYNCFNFAFTIPKALLLIGNCLFNLVFSKHCYCFSPLKRKKEKHFRKESVITFLVHPQIGIPRRSLWLCESRLSIWKVIHNKWSDRTV